MASNSTKFLASFAGKQTSFGTPVAATFKLPFTGDYEDTREHHMAEYDSGYWTPRTIVDVVSTSSRFTMNGTGFFELLPVLLNAGHDHITVSGAGPYTYDDEVSPSAVGTPRGYTFFFSSNRNIGGTGPCIRISDAYLESFSLAGNINTKEVALTSQWFGGLVDDASAAGFATPAVNLPSPLEMMRTLTGTLEIQDATTTGGNFLTMTAFGAVLLDWQFNCDFGLRPLWTADNNALTYVGTRQVMPVASFTATIRTNSTTYGLIKTKANANTYQELMLSLYGNTNGLLKLKMTGRWQPDVTAHARQDDDVVMKGTFNLETSYLQVTTPHWLSWELDTNWTH